MTSHPTVSPIGATAPWYYANAQNQPVGPLSFTELQQLAAAGVINPETQVIQQGGTEWMPFLSIQPAFPALQIPDQAVNASGQRQRQLTLLSLLILPPLGLIFLWRSEHFGRLRKIMVTLMTLVVPLPFFLLVVSSLLFSGNSSRSVQSNAGASFTVSSTAEHNSGEKPTSFKPGTKVIVAKGSTLLSDRELLVQLLKAFADKDDGAANAISEQIAREGKSGTASENSVVTVLEGELEGAFYKLEGTTGGAERQIWYAMAADLRPYTPPSAGSTNASGSQEKEQSSTRANVAEKQNSPATFGLTVEAFREAFNAQVAGLAAESRFKIDDIKVNRSGATDTFAVAFTKELVLTGSLDRTSQQVDELTVIASSSDAKAVADLIVLPVVAIATVAPSLERGRRGEVVLDLYNKAVTKKDESHRTLEGGLNLGAAVYQKLGAVMFFISPEGKRKLNGDPTTAP